MAMQKHSLRIWKLSSVGAAALLCAISTQGLVGCSYVDDFREHMGLKDPRTMPEGADVDFGEPMPPANNPATQRAIEQQRRQLEGDGGAFYQAPISREIAQETAPAPMANVASSDYTTRKTPVENRIAMAEVQLPRMTRMQTHANAPVEMVTASQEPAPMMGAAAMQEVPMSAPPAAMPQQEAAMAPIVPAAAPQETAMEPIVLASAPPEEGPVDVQITGMAEPTAHQELAVTAESAEPTAVHSAENMATPAGGYAAPVQEQVAEAPASAVDAVIADTSAPAATTEIPTAASHAEVTPAAAESAPIEMASNDHAYPTLHDVSQAPEYAKGDHRQEILQALMAEGAVAETKRDSVMQEPTSVQKETKAAMEAPVQAAAATPSVAEPVTPPEAAAEISRKEPADLASMMQTPPPAPLPQDRAPLTEAVVAAPVQTPPSAPAVEMSAAAVPTSAPAPDYAVPSAKNAPVETLPDAVLAGIPAQEAAPAAEAVTVEVGSLPNVTEVSDANAWSDEDVMLKQPEQKRKHAALLPDSRYSARRHATHGGTATALAPLAATKYE